MLPAQTQIIEAIFTDAVRELAHSAPSSDATDISITLERPKIAAPGFINVRIYAQAKQTVVAQILAQKAQFGWKPSTPKGRQRVLIEFVSANPTGPLHVGHARQAVLGDVLANLLATQGWQVQREYYYNDAGVQIQNLALSVAARARGLQPGDAGWPDAAYHGEYIADIARDYLMDEEGKSDAGDANALEHIRLFAVAYLRREQDA